MKKKFRLLMALIFMVSVSCGGEDPAAEPVVDPFHLPVRLFLIEKVYDIANNGNSSDVRVELRVSSFIETSDLVDVRLVMTKASATFTEDQIEGLAAGTFFSIPISSDARQVVKPAGIMDSDGDAIVNGTAYKIYMAVIGKENTTQLSSAKELTLQNKPVYAGDYVGTWRDLGPPGPGEFPVTLRIAEDYTAQLFYSSDFTPYGRGPAEQDVTAVLTITGDTFTFDANQFIDKYIGGGAFTAGSDGGCPASSVLSGTIQDDITLDFDEFSWADCDGTRDVKMKFTRK